MSVDLGHIVGEPADLAGQPGEPLQPLELRGGARSDVDEAVVARAVGADGDLGARLGGDRRGRDAASMGADRRRAGEREVTEVAALRDRELGGQGPHPRGEIAVVDQAVELRLDEEGRARRAGDLLARGDGPARRETSAPRPAVG